MSARRVSREPAVWVAFAAEAFGLVVGVVQNIVALAAAMGVAVGVLVGFVFAWELADWGHAEMIRRAGSQ